MSQQTLFERETRSGMQVSSRQKAGENFDLRRIGELLRETRERKGLSLSDVSDSLFLTKSTLGAIESGHWDVLPHPVYVKGYVKSYADYLDVYERIEEHLCPVEAPKSEGRDGAPALRQNRGPYRENRSMRRIGRVSLRSLALLCSSVVGFAFGMTTSASPVLCLASSAGLKDVVNAFHAAVLSL